MIKKVFFVFLIFLLLCVAVFAESDIIIKKSSGGKLSFRLKNADINTVLQIFSRQLGVNIVAADEIKGKVSLSFSNVDPLEGLDAILRVNGYNWVKEGNTIIVSSGKAVKTYSLQFANAKEVETSIKPLLGSDDSISVNASYNQIIVKAGSDKISSINKAIELIDVPQTQVVVEAHIVEIKRSDDGTIGVDLKAASARDANDFVQTLNFAGRYSASTTSTPGLFAQVISDDYSGYLSAVLQEQNYNIIASPRLTTINHKEAYILIGEKLGYQTTTTTTTGTSTSIEFLETGTKLVLTPHVSDKGFIRMEIQPKVSEGSVTSGIPNENTTETKNEVLVKDGQTIVIGGLIKKKETKTEYGVPVLMNIPFIGMLFKRTVIANENRELVIFIKPSIVTVEYLKGMQQGVRDFLKKEEKQKSNLIE